MLSLQLKDARSRKAYKLRELASITGIDQTLISRFEKGDRIPTEEQLELLAGVLDLNIDQIKISWMADKVVKMVQYEPHVAQILTVAESRVEYLSSEKYLEQRELSPDLKSRLDTLDKLRDKWSDKRPLDKSQLKRLHEYFDVEYTYESNRIEGNTLTLHETALVVNQGLTIGGKSLKEHLEIVNHAEAIEYVRSLTAHEAEFTNRILLDIHRLVLKEVDSANAGKYRTVPVRISGSKSVLPQPYLIDKLMEDYFEYYKMNRKFLHPVILAAEMHERLVSIHPFIDGNGRTARLVMNLILVKYGYTRANIKGSTEGRMRYYQALEAVQVDADPTPFYELIIEECILSLQDHLELV